jgi:hypothetical protein
MDVSKISNTDFARLQRKLAKAGYLKKGFVSKDADWQFDFSGRRELILLSVRDFLRDVGTELTKKDLALLEFMLEHTNKHGRCSGCDE